MNFQELLTKMAELDQPVVEQEEKAEEGNEFSGALAKAKAAGAKEFEVDGKRYQVKEDDTVEECGMPGMDNMPSGMMGAPKQQDSVSMNVSMNGSGAGGIRDLMSILRNIENGGEGSDIDIEPERFGDKDMDVIVKKQPGMDIMTIDDDFANEPDEMYGNMDSVTGTGDDLHSKGKEAPKVNGGGNPMKVAHGETFKLPSGDLKIKLESLYQDIKLREGSGPKEKQHSKYVDRNSAESKAKVQAAKDKMAADKKAEPGKKLLSKMKAK